MDFDGELTQFNTQGYDTIEGHRLVVLFSRIKLRFSKRGAPEHKHSWVGYRPGGAHTQREHTHAFPWARPVRAEGGGSVCVCGGKGYAWRQSGPRRLVRNAVGFNNLL